MAIPKKPSQYSGIPVHDVNSAQEALLQIMDSPAKEKSSEVEETIETTEEVSAQGMEPESVETEVEDNSQEGLLETEELGDDNQEEDGETPDAYTIRVDGKDVEVTLEELKNGYSRQADYTRKSQVLSEQRQKADAELATTQQERQRYQAQLEQINLRANSEAAKYKNIDWERLKQDDTAEYYAKRDAYRDLQDNQRKLQDEQQRLAVKGQQDAKTQYQRALSEQQEILKQRLPKWFDQTEGRKLKDSIINYATSNDVGFTQEEVNSLIDARSVQILHKAMLYDKLNKTKIGKKRTKVVPRVTKPGNGTTRGDVASVKTQQLKARAKSSGKVGDAAALIESLMS